MRRKIPIVCSILILLFMILGTGCVTQSSPGQTTRQDVQLPQTAVPSDIVRISFEEARAELVDYRIQALNEPVNPTKSKFLSYADMDRLKNAATVYYLRSRDLDGSGNATGWTFGVFKGDMAEFLLYDGSGWTTIANATLPAEAIVLDDVVSPGVLFKKNKDIIVGNGSPAIPERRDIELQRGIYTLTITSGSASRTLAFNATTGALIP